MLSEEQYKEKLEKIKYSIESFINGNKTIDEIAKDSNGYVSSSSIQRYLHEEDIIRELYPDTANEIIEKINNKLTSNKEEGHSLGGTNFSKNNEATKDELGHFTGSVKKEENSIEKKFKTYMPFVLEYRLGLKNFSKLIEEPESDIIDYVNTLNESTETREKYNQYSFVLYKDGKDDPKSLFIVRRMIVKYVAIQNDPTLTDEEKQGKLNYILYKTDFEKEQIKPYAENRPHEDYMALSKYRLKYAISANKVTESENERKRLSHHEQEYDPELVERLDGLEDYLRVYANQMYSRDLRNNMPPKQGEVREIDQANHTYNTIESEENKHHGM